MIKTKKPLDKRFSSKLNKKSRNIQEMCETFWQTHHDIPSSRKYNLTICDNPKFVWFRNAKAATRSTLEALSHTKIKLTAEQARQCYYSPQKYNDYFKFAFVRNPWDRLVSGWHNKIFQKKFVKFKLESTY